MLKYITLAAIVYFFYWLFKQKIRQRKLEAQGIVIEPNKGLRPITLLSIVMVVLYGGYLIYHVIFEANA